MPDGYKNNFLSTIGFANYPRVSIQGIAICLFGEE